ncbi:hypothetical protein M8818_007934 [Zalaria obscura]|uniref:Uncharacterized protein n=1 Tax=Zalaria obscura TaxID=2024903 RepID=A0ACC3S3F1_9PEZI
MKSDGGVIQEISDAHSALDECSRPVTPIEQAIQPRRLPFRYSTTTASDTLPDSDQSDADDTKSHELATRIKPRPDLDGEVYRGDIEGGSAETECNTDVDDWVDVDVDVSESGWTMV